MPLIAGSAPSNCVMDESHDRLLYFRVKEQIEKNEDVCLGMLLGVLIMICSLTFSQGFEIPMKTGGGV